MASGLSKSAHIENQMSFDPYLKWLGIRDPHRPPNHYRLLGIEVFESDVDVISTAADRQMAHVRRYQNGEHSTLSQQILNEISTARLCLLDEKKRAKYDVQLRRSNSTKATGASKSPSFTNAWLLTVMTLLVACVPIAYWWNQPTSDDVILNNAPHNPFENTTTVEPRADETTATNVTASDTTAKTLVPTPPTPATSRLPKSNTNPWITQKRVQPRTVEFRTPFLVALATRDLPVAQRTLDALALSQSVTPAQQRQAAKLLGELSEFWEAVDNSLVELETGDIFQYRDQRVAVESMTSSSLKLSAGDGSEVFFQTDRAKIEAELAVALATRKLRATGRDRERILRSFWACHNRDIARFVGLNSLPAPSKTTTLTPQPRPQVNRPPTDVALVANPSPVTIPALTPKPKVIRLPVPERDELERNRKLLQKTYGTQLDAKTRNAKIVAAAQLLSQAKKTSNDNSLRYTLLQESIRLANSSGHAEQLWDAFGELESGYDINLDQERLKSIAQLARRGDLNDWHMLNRLGEKRMTQAIHADDFELARRYQRALLGAAKQVKDDERVQYYQAMQGNIKEIERELAFVSGDLERLKTQPDSPAANHTAGLFQCLVKGDAVAGLPMMAKSDQADVRDLAKLELSQSDKDIVNLGDRWWKLSGELQGLAARNARKRATTHYADALTRLKGPARQQVVNELVQPGKSSVEVSRLLQLNDVVDREWKIVWTDHPVWDRLRFEPGGNVKLVALNKNWVTNRWKLSPNSLEIYGGNGEFLYHLKPRARGQLYGEKYRRAGQTLMCTGHGTIINTSQ